jgi:hypothetical protein
MPASASGPAAPPPRLGAPGKEESRKEEETARGRVKKKGQEIAKQIAQRNTA